MVIIWANSVSASLCAVGSAVVVSSADGVSSGMFAGSVSVLQAVSPAASVRTARAAGRRRIRFISVLPGLVMGDGRRGLVALAFAMARGRASGLIGVLAASAGRNRRRGRVRTAADRAGGVLAAVAHGSPSSLCSMVALNRYANAKSSGGSLASPGIPALPGNLR